MKKNFWFFSILLFFLPAIAASDFVKLRSNKATYTEGENAILRAVFLTKPDNSNFQFDITGILNAEALSVERVTDYQMFSTAKNLLPGTYTWSVTVVIQDARYARDLKVSIAYYAARITELEDLIAVETDPEALEVLEHERSKQISKKSAAESELSRIRTPVREPMTLQFTVEEAIKGNEQ